MVVVVGVRGEDGRGVEKAAKGGLGPGGPRLGRPQELAVVGVSSVEVGFNVLCNLVREFRTGTADQGRVRAPLRLPLPLQLVGAGVGLGVVGSACSLGGAPLYKLLMIMPSLACL